jgi:hypothetical protein
MAKYKPYDYGQRVMVAVSLEEQLVPGTLEFAIQTLVEDRMDCASSARIGQMEVKFSLHF